MHLTKKRGEKNLPDASDVLQVYLALTQGPCYIEVQLLHGSEVSKMLHWMRMCNENLCFPWGSWHCKRRLSSTSILQGPLPPACCSLSVSRTDLS